MNALLQKLNKIDKFYLIGTSTNIGKTFIGLKIAKYLIEKNTDFVPLKPIETGKEGGIIGPDTAKYLALLQEKNPTAHKNMINFFSIDYACSPHLSYELEKKIVLIDDIISFISKRKYALIELVGGLMVPLNANENQVDLIKRHPLPIVLVADANLGCLNHVMLTFHHLKSIFIKDIYLVLNHFDFKNKIHRKNNDYLSQFLPCYTMEEISDEKTDF